MIRQGAAQDLRGATAVTPMDSTLRLPSDVGVQDATLTFLVAATDEYVHSHA